MQTPDTASLSFEERLSLLVDVEVTTRQDRRLSRLLKAAKLRENACIEDIDFRQNRGLDKSMLLALGSCNWVRAHQSVLISGPTGVGKTYIGCVLANAACRQGYSAHYYRTPRLLTELKIARADGSIIKLLDRLAKTEVLLIDDWGINALSDLERKDLLEVIEDRYKVRSTIIISQLPIDKWHDAIGDPTVADAVLDRLVHTSYKITMKGGSMRKLDSNLTDSDQS